MAFKPVESVSTTLNLFFENAGYVILRTLALMALVLVLGLVSGGIFVGMLFGAGAGFASIGSDPSPAAVIAALGSLAFGALVLALVMIIVGTVIQLGFVRSLFRLVVSGEGRYDLFAPFGRSMQLVSLFVLIYVGVAAVMFGVSWFASASPIVSGVLALVLFLVLFWFGVQLSLVQYRMFGHDENAFVAAAGSYRMFSGSRWAFLLTIVLLTVLLAVVSAILSFIPVLGWLVLIALDFLMAPLVVIWLAVVHQQLDPATTVV